MEWSERVSRWVIFQIWTAGQGMDSYLFIGTHDIAIDEKSRIVMPAPFRKDNSEDLLSSKYIATPHSQGYLIIRPQPSWEQYIQDIRNDTVSEPSLRREFERKLYNNSVKLKLDSQYRIVLNPKLRAVFRFEDEHARQNLKVLGCGQYFEIWPQKFFKGEGESLAELSDLIDRFDGF